MLREGWSPPTSKAQRWKIPASKEIAREQRESESVWVKARVEGLSNDRLARPRPVAVWAGGWTRKRVRGGGGGVCEARAKGVEPCRSHGSGLEE